MIVPEKRKPITKRPKNPLNSRIVHKIGDVRLKLKKGNNSQKHHIVLLHLNMSKYKPYYKKNGVDYEEAELGVKRVIQSIIPIQIDGKKNKSTGNYTTAHLDMLFG